MSEQFLTCSFKLRTPTARKRFLLDYALLAYTNAVQSVLDWCAANLSKIVADGRCKRRDRDTGELVSVDKYDADSIARSVPSSGLWKFALGGSVKEAAVRDACSMMASYLELQKAGDRSVSFPTAFTIVEDERSAALEELRLLGDNLERENELRSAVRRMPKADVRPITFLRSRDIPILIDDQGRLFAALSLLPGDNEMNQPYKFDGRLTDLATGEPMKSGRPTRGTILMPLELGMRGGDYHWQFDKFIAPVLDGSAKIKAAKLQKTAGGEYCLNISFALQCADPYRPTAYLGVGKSVLTHLTRCVIGIDGRVIRLDSTETGLAEIKVKVNARVAEKQRARGIVGLRDFRGQQVDEALHQIANMLVHEAQRNHAAIVIEDASAPPGRKLGKDKLAAPWRKLAFILEYKSNLAGVPYIGERFSTKAATICPNCARTIKLKKKNPLAACPTCGLSLYIGEVVAVNIARRVLYRRAEWEKKGGYIGFHAGFANLPPISTKRELREK